MSHLPTERLAALADEAPTSDELAHLALCEACARERAVHQSLLTMAREEQTRIGLPLTSWDGLAAALVADGIIDPAPHRRSARDGGPGSPRRMAGRPEARRAWGRPWLQAAAALLLAAGGVAAGRASAGHPAIPLFASGARSGDSSAVAATARPAATAVPAPMPADSLPSFRSLEEARAARARYEVLYQGAAAYLAAHDSAGPAADSPASMRRRLAALDRVDETMRAALRQAPYDPVINGYYLTTLGQREVALRQLNAALPEGVRINSF